MARRVRLSLLALVCAALAGGAAWVLIRDHEAPPSPTYTRASEPTHAARPAPTLVGARPSEAASLPQGAASAPEAELRANAPARRADAPRPAAPPTASPSGGRVVDANGRPVGGAELTPVPAPIGRRRTKAERIRAHRERWRAHSISDGSFSLPGVPSSGLLQVKAAGFVPRQVPLAKPRARLTIVLRRSRRHLGTVVAAEDLSPLRNARVLAQATNWRATKWTDPIGRFTVQPPADETLWLLVSAKERVSKVWNEKDHPTVELAQGRGVRGRVLQVTQQGLRPASHLRAFVVGATQRASPPQRARVQSDGTFELKGGIDPQEEFTVVAFDHRYASPLKLKWHPAGTDDVQVLLVERGGVELHNGPSHGRLVPRPVNGIQGLAPNPSVRPRTLERGHGRWYQLAPGQYQFSHDGVRVGLTFKVESGRTTQVRWKSRASAKRTRRATAKKTPTATDGHHTVNVRVLDGLGRPVFGATVLASRKDTKPHTATTNARGEARLKLTRGLHTLRAKKDGLFLERPVTRDPSAKQGRVTLRLIPPATLRGTLQPPGKATLTLQDGQGKAIATLETTADGAFRFPRLVPGSYTLEITQGASSSAVEVEVPSPDLVIKLD